MLPITSASADQKPSSRGLDAAAARDAAAASK